MKKLLVLLLSLALALSVTGCSGNREESKPQALCVLVGNHGNSQGLNMNSPLVRNTVTEVVAGGGMVAVVNIDGQPNVVCINTYEVDERLKGADPSKLKRDAELKATNLLMAISNVTADDPEVDTLEALRLGRRALEAADPDMEKTILVVDSGLSTVGLDFRNNLLSADPQDIAQALAEKSALPDLKGITVAWQQLGDVASPQQPLTPAQRAKLAEIWRAIIETSGGTFIYSEMIANPAPDQENYPNVSPVELPSEAPLKYDDAQLEEPSVFSTPAFLTESQVGFIGDSAEYLYPDQALSVLTPIAEYLKANSDTSLLLIGCTAGDGNSDYTMDLSHRRAEAVRNTLVELGAAPEQLSAIGMGSKDPWHIYGEGTSGPLAASNRKVVLLDANTLEAKDLLAGGGWC